MLYSATISLTKEGRAVQHGAYMPNECQPKGEARGIGGVSGEFSGPLLTGLALFYRRRGR